MNCNIYVLGKKIKISPRESIYMQIKKFNKLFLNCRNNQITKLKLDKQLIRIYSTDQQL